MSPFSYGLRRHDGSGGDGGEPLHHYRASLWHSAATGHTGTSGSPHMHDAA